MNKSDLEAVLFEESAPVKPEEAGAVYDDGALLPGLHVHGPLDVEGVSGDPPGGHHGGQGAVDGSGELVGEGGGEAHQGGAGAQQDVGGVAAPGHGAWLILDMANLGQLSTLLLRTSPDQQDEVVHGLTNDDIVKLQSLKARKMMIECNSQTFAICIHLDRQTHNDTTP